MRLTEAVAMPMFPARSMPVAVMVFGPSASGTFMATKVRFTQAAGELVREGVRTFVEVGPGNVLAGLVKRIDRSVKTISVSTPEEIDELEETLASA